MKISQVTRGSLIEVTREDLIDSPTGHNREYDVWLKVQPYVFSCLPARARLRDPRRWFVKVAQPRRRLRLAQFAAARREWQNAFVSQAMMVVVR